MPPEPSQAYRKNGWHDSLDKVPMRSHIPTGESRLDRGASSSRSNHPPQEVVYPKLSGLPPPSPPSVGRQSNYSPTPSDIDALEESYFDYEIQSQSLIDDAGIPTVASHIASSANYIQDDAASTASSTYLSLPDTVEDTLVDAPKSTLKERLHLAWPKCPSGLEDAPIVVLWELTRVAAHCDVDIAHAHLQFDESWKDQDVFWTTLKNLRGFKGRKFPMKSDPRAWRAGMDGGFNDGNQAVIFTATMHTTDSTTGPPARVELEPLKCEQSSRLFRHFGSDRFLEVRIPSLDSWQTSEDDMEEVMPQWLTTGRHAFLNRLWSAFYVRDRPLKSQLSDDINGREAKAVFYDRVLFFAEASANPHSSRSLIPMCSRIEMLNWLLSLKDQDAESYLKLFHRVSLGMTKTIPVMVLDEAQIWNRPEDIVSVNTGEVMNDGAGRISPSLMRRVRDTLGLQTIPSAIQGRLGSAKGMWLVDVKDQSNEDWIETYPKQRKWICDLSKEAHRTLEVRSWSTELSSASLNIQFLPILEDRARDPLRMRATFVRNMRTESEAALEDLKLSLQHTELFRKWAREGSQPSSQRLTSRSMPFLGGLPENYEDIMSFLVDGGFEPMHLKFLQTIVFQKQRMKGDAMKEELKIKIAKSTYAYMLVDFWGVLKPDEVHLCFSSKFDDGTDELSDLDNRKVLVARSPAHLPSDIQKVKAVFKPELRHLRDVIIFSSKGDLPLAAKLSGGDYDGDKAWVCWDPDFVDNFRNHSLPPKPDFSPYLSKDSSTLGDLRRSHSGEHYLDVMLEKAFRFNLKQKYLGSCTSYKEKYTYHCGRVSDKTTIKLSWLLSELADQPKQGILFGQQDWKRFRDDVVGKKPNLLVPAYKTGGAALRPNAKHVIDYLMYAAKQEVDKSLTDLHRFMEASGASNKDGDVSGYWDHFERTFGDHSRYGRPRCAWFVTLRDGLKSDMDACMAEWRDAMRQGLQGYQGKVRHIYSRWRAIHPRLPNDDAASLSTKSPTASSAAETARKFLLEQDLVVAPDLSRWELLKASLAFRHYGESRFVWQMAARQLQAIKALAARSKGPTTSGAHLEVPLAPAAPPVVVVPNMYVALRPDNTYIKRLMALEGDEDVDFFESRAGGESGGGLEELLLPSSQETD